MTTDLEVKKSAQTPSIRFTNAVLAEFTSGIGEVQVAEHHKRLIQNYFITLDQSLSLAETKRLATKEEYRKENVPMTWQNVNMPKLAVNVVSLARIGLDPALPNQINLIPYKNKHTGKYDIGCIDGYRGKELIAKKYAYESPVDVITELVYATDKFKPIKKDISHKIETYEFEVTNHFDRGGVVGGFYYHVYEDEKKNKLMFYNLAQIEKRKPKYASAEFWGGEKDKWKNNKVVGKEKVEGWLEEMLWKTIVRMAYSDITLDSKKIDADYVQLKSSENELNAIPIDNSDDSDTRNTKTLNIDNIQNKEEIEPVTEVKKETKTKPPEKKQEAVSEKKTVTGEKLTPPAENELFKEPTTKKKPSFE